MIRSRWDSVGRFWFFSHFLDCRIRNSKSQQFRQLRHGQSEVDSLLAEVFAERSRSGRVVP